MFRWQNPFAFYYLSLLPLLLVLIVFVWRAREKSLKEAFHSRLAPFLVKNRSLTKRKIKIALELLVLVLALFALARPQFGQSQQKIKSEGIELVIALDVSKSMLAEDTKPSRLSHARNEVNRLLDRLSGDKVGLLAFAGSALLLSPMTNDYGAIRLFLETVGPDSVTTGGSNFKSAIDVAVGAFKRGGIDPEEGVSVTKVLLIVTDGEATTAGEIEAAQKARNEGVRIFTLGIGTRSGAPIPERDEFGNLKGYKKDNSGNPILSTTKEEALASLAQAGGGGYYHADFSGSAIASIKQDIEKMEKMEFESDMAVDYDEKYQPILLLAVLLALLELLLGERKKESGLWRGRFEVSG